MKFLDAKIGLWALEGGYWLVFRPFFLCIPPPHRHFFHSLLSSGGCGWLSFSSTSCILVFVFLMTLHWKS